MVYKIFRRLFLTMAIIFALFSIIVLLDIIFRGGAETLGALWGMLILGSLFAVPYWIFFRKPPDNKNKSPKITRPVSLTARRCSNCNSSRFTTYKNGYQCEHCGSIYE